MDYMQKGWIYWTPRVLGILYSLFLLMFSFDVLGTGGSFWQTFAGFLIHSIPTFILLAAVIVSWKYEIVGGIAFILLAVVYLIFLAVGSGSILLSVSWGLTIAGPALLVGILFLIGWRRKRKSGKRRR